MTRWIDDQMNRWPDDIWLEDQMAEGEVFSKTMRNTMSASCGICMHHHPNRLMHCKHSSMKVSQTTLKEDIQETASSIQIHTVSWKVISAPDVSPQISQFFATGFPDEIQMFFQQFFLLLISRFIECLPLRCYLSVVSIRRYKLALAATQQQLAEVHFLSRIGSWLGFEVLIKQPT